MSLTKTQRFRILVRDHFTCRYCGKSAPAVQLEVDHRTPRCEGGTDADANLVAACHSCNRGKRGMVLPECQAEDEARTLRSLWVLYALEEMCDSQDDEFEEEPAGRVFWFIHRISPPGISRVLKATREFIQTTPQPRASAAAFMWEVMCTELYPR